jgi:hypothetical protein
MRHVLPAAFFAFCLALAVAALDRVGRHGDQAGVLFIVTRGTPGPALAFVSGGQDLRVLDVWMGGRVVQLHADSLRQVRVTGDGVLFALRLPLRQLALPGCA